MSKEQIRREISYYEGLIGKCQSNIADLDQKVQELAGLRAKLSKLQTDFQQKQNFRKSKLSILESTDFNIKLVGKYISGMKSLLSGNDFNRANNGLSVAKREVNQKIQVINAEVNNEHQKISQYRNTISGLRWRLQMELAKEAQNNGGK